MKKIMITMLVAAVAAVSFGSQVKWTASNVFQSGTTTKISGTAAYFFLTGDTSGKYADNIVDYTTIIGAIAGGTWDGTGSLGGKYTMTGGLSEGAVIADIDGTGSSYTASGFVVFFDGEDFASSGNYMVTPVTTSAAITSATGTKMIGFGTQAGNSWVAISTPTPEPTSGLLLVLGMAGLALRRRRA